MHRGCDPVFVESAIHITSADLHSNQRSESSEVSELQDQAKPEFIKTPSEWALHCIKCVQRQNTAQGARKPATEHSTTTNETCCRTLKLFVL